MNNHESQKNPESERTATHAQEEKAAWQEPRLTFVEPELTRQGDITELTQGFFGTFIPTR